MNPRLSVWPPLPPSVYLRRPVAPLPFPLEEPSCRVVAWARHGLWHGVRGLGLAEGDEVLVPAWHHGSEVEALQQAGLTCRFYDATADLVPDRDELEGLLGPRAKALHLTHTLGFPQDGPGWRAWCDERGLALIEDGAQAWLAERDGRPIGSSGDLAVFCLYKTFGLSEGAAMLQSSPPPSVGLDPRFGVAALARGHAMWLAGRSAVAYAASAPFRRPKPYDPVRDFELRDPAAAPWRHTMFVLRRVARPGTAEQRRANYRFLLNALAELVPPPFETVPAGAAPFAFPIAVSDKAGVLTRLRGRGVIALDLWAVPHPALEVDRFPGAARCRSTMLALPVHQELRPRDLEQVVSAVRAVV